MKHLGLPARNHWSRKWFPLVLSYDPEPAWERVRIPVLNNLGELDGHLRPSETTAILERALTKAGNRDYTIKLWPGADHGILVKSKLGRPYLADGFMDSLTEWLLQRVTVRTPAQPGVKGPGR